MRKPVVRSSYECKLAAKVVESFRPERKYSGEDKSMDFLDFMSHFESVVNREGFSAQLKLFELSYWFEGSAFLSIEDLLTRSDYDMAFDEAVKILKEENRGNEVSVENKLAPIMEGRKLNLTDSGAIHTFMGKLTQIFKQAVKTGRDEEFNQKRLIQNILQFRLPDWFKHNWVEKVAEAEMEGVAFEWTFEKFIKFLQAKSLVVKAMADFPAQSLEMDSGNESEEASDDNLREPMQNCSEPILETSQSDNLYYSEWMEPSTYEQEEEFQVVERKRKRHSKPHLNFSQNQQVRCLLCNGAHRLSSCHDFKHMMLEDRQEVCWKRAACFRCLSPGHKASQCRSGRLCLVCHGTHNTLLHSDY